MSIGTNARAEVLAFQMWHHFNEAAVPELIARGIKESDLKVRTCFNQFGGTGTSALACQFLRINPMIIEVNPFLANLAIAKLCSYNLDHLIYDASLVIRRVQGDCEAKWNPFLPDTFIERKSGGSYY